MTSSHSAAPLRPRRLPLARGVAVLLLLGVVGRSAAQVLGASELGDMTLEQLANVQVTSVTGRPEPVQEVAASIFVITAEDIRRSTATNLPEALRIAPNLQVAQISAGQYAISARGFNEAISNKLLVLIDGRTVYSPLFSGVYWDAQHVLLEDVERIEVISGPGATLWGANAVNGVINVITQPASATRGAFASATVGRRESVASARIGGALGTQGDYRLYAMRLQRNNTSRADAIERSDAASTEQVGFRVDWGLGADQFNLQGDAYRSKVGTASNLAPNMDGANLLARWSRRLADGSNWQLQAYFDQSRRDETVFFDDETRTVDLQFNHVPASSARHKVLWGGGWRQAHSTAGRTQFFVFDPAMRRLSWANVFAQDEIRVSEAFRLTLGAKFETNVYTGLEVLPTVRGAYDLGRNGLLWASLSRAVRAPARLDRELFFPTAAPFSIQGGPNFVSEVANVAEIGYRARPTQRLSFSATGFLHDYDRLRAGTPAPTFIENRASGQVRGVEGWGTFEVSPAWRLSAGMVELRKSLRSSPGSAANAVSVLGNDPRRRWSLRSAASIGRNLELDVSLRHIGSLPAPAVPAYTATDIRLAWQASPKLSVSLLLDNAFDRRHVEFGAPATASQLPRSLLMRLQWALP